ncbi:MAG: HflX-like GTP-binding protein, partial [Candidatus Thorarchaeota archaeon]
MDSYTALLVQRRKKNEPDLLEEFEALATTAGYSVIGRFDVLGPPTSKFGIRKGKVEEITTWIEINSPEFALISPQINSSQMFRLMEEWEIEVRDRTQVILEIFDRHA